MNKLLGEEEVLKNKVQEQEKILSATFMAKSKLCSSEENAAILG